jgi:hypothetical protein
MSSDPPAAVHALIEFLYICDYNLTDSTSKRPLSTHASIATIADKYCVPHLQRLAVSNFVAAATTLRSADSEDLRLDFLAAIEYLYSSCPNDNLEDDDTATQIDSTLQYQAVVLAKQHSDILFHKATAGSHVFNKAKDLLVQYPDFAVDMALASTTVVQNSAATQRTEKSGLVGPPPSYR